MAKKLVITKEQQRVKPRLRLRATKVEKSLKDYQRRPKHPKKNDPPDE